MASWKRAATISGFAVVVAVSNSNIFVHNACQDRGMIDKIAKILKMTNELRREFGKYVESYKYRNGIPNNATLSWSLLKQLAQEFLGH